MRAIPVLIRKRIREPYEGSQLTRQIAQYSGFGLIAVRRVRQYFRERGTLEPRTQLCGCKTPLTEERKRRLEQMLSERPGATPAE